MIKELFKIQKLLDEANDIYETLSDRQKDKLLGFHTEQYSLPHCLRWGLQAAEENIEGIEEDVIAGKTVKVDKNQIYYDKMASEFVVEKFEFNDDYKGTGEPQYSVVDGFDNFREAFVCAENPKKYMQKRMGD